MIHLYLDDYRSCPKGLVLARYAEECILLLQEFEVDVLSLDYDLGWGHPNGMHVVTQIVTSGRYPRRIYLHTSSDSGRQAMFQMLYSHKPDHVQLHNGPMTPELLMEIAQSAQE
ncbi:cyclic-phosphate processing receiver domain-containing protein [Paenibacillus cremeus]|uniref:Cell division protein FtsJ n=1 Tax=Paenibacillus cremeus TaxID=2163881 RepID=A0A559KDE5_9BACL|nr:cyclic-phosphate processing receiver domain-containing protein [Paenibacillus cremeus]TVY10123.1 cell division protein FtsJ [Paenibacillus cremeus]